MWFKSAPPSSTIPRLSLFLKNTPGYPVECQYQQPWADPGITFKCLCRLWSLFFLRRGTPHFRQPYPQWRWACILFQKHSSFWSIGTSKTMTVPKGNPLRDEQERLFKQLYPTVPRPFCEAVPSVLLFLERMVLEIQYCRQKSWEIARKIVTFSHLPRDIFSSWPTTPFAPCLRWPEI